MKKLQQYISLIAASLVASFACTPEIEIPTPTTGNLDFSNFIAIGSSLNAGFSDDGLYAEVQMQSYPYLIAQQISDISPIEFRQPDIPGNGSGYLYVTSLDVSTDPPDIGLDRFTDDGKWLNQLEGPFNNLGVPAMRVKDITFNGYGASPQVNPYFYRMLGGKSATTSYLQLVAENPPTFFTSWLGDYDVLGYASVGGAFGIDGLPGTGFYGLTDPSTEFKPSYDALINTLSSGGSKGVVVTVPDVTLAPFFTTVPWNGLELDEATASAATQFYAYGIDTTVQRIVETEVFRGAATQQVYSAAYQQAIDGGASEQEAQAIAEAYLASPDGQAAMSAANDLIAASYYGLPDEQKPFHPLYSIINETKNGIIAALDAAGLIPKFSEGPNPFVIEVPVSPANPLGIRQMKEGEFVLLTALLEGQFEGQTALFPKSDRYILTSDEVKNVRDYTAAYNEIIEGYGASSNDIVLFDSNEIFEEIDRGLYADGIAVNGEFLTGGAYSLDGVNLTPRGSAIVANALIDHINTSFNATIPTVILNFYRDVILS